MNNAAGTSVLNVDTTNRRVGFGTDTPGYDLDVANGGNIKSDLGYRFGSAGNSSAWMFPFSGGTHTTPDASGRNVCFYSYSTTGSNKGVTFSGESVTTPTGVYHNAYYSRSFLPTSGSAEFNTMAIAPTINQTGSANGITRGLYIDTIVTSASDYRALEVGVGNTVLGTTSGSLGLGETAPETPIELTHATRTSRCTTARTRTQTVGRNPKSSSRVKTVQVPKKS